jgi:hypothetical protein
VRETPVHDIDYELAYTSYQERFAAKFGERAPGAFVKFGKNMVQKLQPAEFKGRLDAYVRLHTACKHMLDAGSTISDSLVLDFVESAAWISVEAPNMYALFRGELGDPKLAAPDRIPRTGEHEITDPEVRDPDHRETLIDAPRDDRK